MKKTTTLCAAIFAIAALSTTVKAQTVTTTAGANIVEAITLTEDAPLHFGTMTVPTTAATVTIDDAGIMSSAGSVTLLPTQAPFKSQASYTVNGAPNATYAITLPTSTIISDGTPADNMIVDAFTCSASALVGALSFSGSDNFSLGATLHLANAQPAQVYFGVFNVSVAYN
jgi:hypothetical protein